MKTNPVMEFAIYQSVKFASSAPVALIGGILRFGTYNMVILSLFDGMSCGQIALKELGVTIDKYYASEIDKFAIQNTMANFPDTVQLGDVRQVDAKSLGKIDLLIGGSPCQCFSFAGKRAGMSTKSKEQIETLTRYLELKQQGFEFEGQSYLFWEYVRILNELREANPNILFMLENVKMGKRWEAVINEALGIVGVHINSALVSAQVRKRIYWTNIKLAQCDLFGLPQSAIPQPTDRRIFIKDILQDEVDEKYFLSPEYVEKLLAYNKRQEEHGNGFKAIFHKETDKMCTLTVGGRSAKDLICVAQRGRSYRGEPYQQNRVYAADGKSPALMNGHGGQTINALVGGLQVRRLTPTECARLQTIPEWYKWEVSETQQYRMLGNGWTVEVIKHILSFLPDHLKK
jgi:DNA (cytosine-5)-methyltransferase 3A